MTLIDSLVIVAPLLLSQPANDPVQFRGIQRESVQGIRYEITIADQSTSGRLQNIDDLYENAPGIFTFRGGMQRRAEFEGQVKGRPSDISRVWTFRTEYDSRETATGTWGGGSGWTGQPLHVKWPSESIERFKKESHALTKNFTGDEIIISSLCGNMYFIDFQSGKESREYIELGNPIKGTASLDPRLNGNIYVGHGIPAEEPIGRLAINLFSHKRIFFTGRDPKAWRAWSAADSSPIYVGGFLFWPSENGTLYKYSVSDSGEIKLHSYLRYRRKEASGAAGIENSMCVYKNYGWFGDNYGDILCIDLNTLKPVWRYNIGDDIDGSIVCEVIDGMPLLYCGCEVDRQGDEGKCHIVKLNGLTGEAIWDSAIQCRKHIIGSKHHDGGLYCTPLLGAGNCDGMIFMNIAQPGKSLKGDFMALDTETGKVLYSTHLDAYAWSSPIAIYNENDELFIFTGDTIGNAYLIEGKTGKIICKKLLGNNFESSPIVIGNEIVVGSRGREIYKFAIK